MLWLHGQHVLRTIYDFIFSPQLLATVLTGQAKVTPQLQREFSLLAERVDHSHSLQAASGLDLLLHFNASTDSVLQRASQQGEFSSGRG